MAMADSPTKTCGEAGCGRPLRARGLCSTHYNQQHQPGRHAKVTVPCTRCEKPCEKEPGKAKRYGGLFCSLSCRDAWRAATGNNPCPPGKDRCAVPWRTCPDCGQEWFRYGTVRQRCDACKASPTPKAPRTRWVAGTCKRCGTSFVDVWLGVRSAQYCSTICGKRDVKDRRRARKKDAYVEDVWRQRIFERDGWRCQLCRKKVDRTKAVPHPKAPVLDHIIPLARGGTHEPRNVQCAHFMCNSIKSDRGYGEQLLLIG